MKTRVTEEGLLVPKHWLQGVDEVDIRRERNVIVIVPVVSQDPIFNLGRHPVTVDVDNASVQHDAHLDN